MTIAREEIFGPVMVLIPYKGEEDAIRIANDTVYGLSGHEHSGNIVNARRGLKNSDGHDSCEWRRA